MSVLIINIMNIVNTLKKYCGVIEGLSISSNLILITTDIFCVHLANGTPKIWTNETYPNYKSSAESIRYLNMLSWLCSPHLSPLYTEILKLLLLTVD